jgi:photosystem II stability/assembly factor-like uncharacterized protein
LPTLWTGSDDGFVHVTRDGGASWQNVTPDDWGEGMINEISVSPHGPGRAYVAFTATSSTTARRTRT